jgi:hypothetical protein
MANTLTQPEALMQLLSVNTARAIWLIETKDLNPRGKNIDVGMIEWLKKTYDFQKYPTFPFEDIQTKGAIFSGGRFPRGTEQDGKEKYIYIDLTIFNDGLVANTRSSTQDSEEFLSEALTLAAAEFHLIYNPQMIRKKLYLSEVDIKLDSHLRLLNPKLEQFAAKISSLRGIAYEFSSISFWPDPVVQQWRPSPFQIERKLNTEWSEERYYAAAPLRTEEHIQLLEEFEQFLAS